MKKIIIILLIASLLSNAIQFTIIINKNNKINTLQYTKQQVLDIFQATSELEQDLYKYEIDTKLGTYYYQAIGKASWILTYMQYNVKYKDDNDPLYQFNLALNNLFGFMITEQGKELVISHSSEIRALLHKIVSDHRESKLNDRNQTIIKLKDYLNQNLSINDSTQQTPKGNQTGSEGPHTEVPAVELPKIVVPSK